MAVKPINRLMLSMGIPMIVSMMLQAVYNIVDSAFVGAMEGVGENALNALTLAFPVQMLKVAVGIGTGVGVNALTARALGQGDREFASRTAGNGIFLSGVIYVIFLLFGIFGVDAYVGSQTSNPEVFSMCSEYLGICCCASFGIVFFPCFEKLLQATGRSVLSTVAQVAGAVTNIVLDPVMIFGCPGVPAMGIAGAAWATVIGQVVSMVLGVVFHFALNREIKKSLFMLKPSWNCIRSIYSVGLPAIIAQALMSVMTYGMNMILGGISENAVTAYGLYYKVQQFVLFAAFGLRDAITPITAFSYGRGNRQRINDGIKYGLIYTCVIMAAGMVLLEIFADAVAGLFGLSGETMGLCVGAVRVISAGFIAAGVNIALQGVFQALNSGIGSLVVSLCRQLVFVLPTAWLLSGTVSSSEDMWRVWIAFPVAEVVTMIIAVLLMRKVYRKRAAVSDDTAQK